MKKCQWSDDERDDDQANPYAGEYPKKAMPGITPHTSRRCCATGDQEPADAEEPVHTYVAQCGVSNNGLISEIAEGDGVRHNHQQPKISRRKFSEFLRGLNDSPMVCALSNRHRRLG